MLCKCSCVNVFDAPCRVAQTASLCLSALLERTTFTHARHTRLPRVFFSSSSSSSKLYVQACFVTINTSGGDVPFIFPHAVKCNTAQSKSRKRKCNHRVR